ncbi:MAG: DUF5018-related domain-containing protein, partial [Bacteroides sp.]
MVLARISLPSRHATPLQTPTAPSGISPRGFSRGDWTNPHKYKIEAANGNTAEWTV